MNSAELDPLANKMLAGLPQADLELVRPLLTVGHFAQGTVLTEAGDEVTHAWFPLSGMISILVVMKDGRAIETATVGREGAFGAMASPLPFVSPARGIVQIGMAAARVPSAQFRKLVQESKALQQLCFQHSDAMLNQARITAACNALHKVEERFCRWMLQTRDVTGNDTLNLTQEFLSEMLGVRRTSITDVASKLQAAGIISYSRGTIRIIDLAALESLSCECYGTLRNQRAL